VSRNEAGQPVAQIAEHVWWTGRDQVWQYENLLRLWQTWSFARVCVDASGIGAGIAAFLANRYPERTEEFVFTAPSKSRLAYGMLAMVNTGRLSIYREDGSAEWRECWKEIAACRYWLRTGEQMGWGVPEREGHDDFVASLALCCQAAEEMAPPPISGLIRAERDDLSEFDSRSW
jgi:pimeloyl-ACP methyl ester carboxylesterase